LTQAPEIALARRLSEFPAVVRAVAEHCAPSRLARYAQSVASDFTQFYMTSRVLVADDEELSVARLALALAAKAVLGTALDLLGVAAPEKMERLDPL
jgi:arginyl-tRNA synthetase